MRKNLPTFIEVLLGDPHLVEGFKRGHNAATNPAGVLSVVGGNQNRLDVLRDLLLDLFVQALAEVCH